jgi:hypothetical protein
MSSGELTSRKFSCRLSQSSNKASSTDSSLKMFYHGCAGQAQHNPRKCMGLGVGWLGWRFAWVSIRYRQAASPYDGVNGHAGREKTAGEELKRVLATA